MLDRAITFLSARTPGSGLPPDRRKVTSRIFDCICSEATHSITSNEKGTPEWVPFTEKLAARVSLGSLLDFAAPNACGADTHTLRTALDQRSNGLQIDIPATLRHVVGMADAVAELRPAMADFTFFCHKTEISFSTKTTV